MKIHILLLALQSRKDSDHHTYSTDVQETSVSLTFFMFVFFFFTMKVIFMSVSVFWESHHVLFHAYLNGLCGNPHFPTSYLSSFTTLSTAEGAEPL